MKSALVRAFAAILVVTVAPSIAQAGSMARQTSHFLGNPRPSATPKATVLPWIAQSRGHVQNRAAKLHGKPRTSKAREADLARGSTIVIIWASPAAKKKRTRPSSVPPATLLMPYFE